MTIEAIAFDLDGTLLNARGGMSEGTVRVLDYLSQEGLHLIVSSGRSYGSLPQDVHRFPGFEFAVTTNGAAIYHMPSDRALIRHTLAKDQVDALLDFTKDFPVGYEFYVDGQSYTERRYLDQPEAFGLSREVMDYIRKTRQPVDHVGQFVADHALDGLSLSVADPAIKATIWHQIQAAFPDLQMTASVPRLIEITDGKASKGQGLEDVLTHLHIPPARLMAFGDGWNDRSMLAFAGHGVVMENAMEGLAEVADDACGHHAQDGVARYLIDYFEIPIQA